MEGVDCDVGRRGDGDEIDGGGDGECRIGTMAKEVHRWRYKQ
jgi:hypothetical protein